MAKRASERVVVRVRACTHVQRERTVRTHSAVDKRGRKRQTEREKVGNDATDRQRSEYEGNNEEKDGGGVVDEGDGCTGRTGKGEMTEGEEDQLTEEEKQREKELCA